ncbi:MAG: hypothetical protein ACYDA4_15855 [Ignavibacteriaceae bacterium]
MRKRILFLFLLLSGFCFAQVSVNLQQPPPNQLRAADLWKLTFINSGKSTLQVRLYGTLEEAREGIIVEGNSKSISLPPGMKRITYDDVKNGNVTFKSGKWREAFTRTGNAPSGDYTICIHVKDNSGEEIGSGCIDQRIEIISSPTLNTPTDGDSITVAQTTIFTWLPPMPPPSGQISYKIKIVELAANQSPEIAIQRNPSWFEQSGIRTTMFQYPVSARNFDLNKKYAWTVQCLNANGEGFGENNGNAQQFTFITKEPNHQLRGLSSTSTDTTNTGGGTGTVSVGDTIKAGLNGEFKAIVSQITTEADSSLTGKGRVYINWLMTSVAVEFKKIRVDTTKRLTSGGIVTSESGSTSTSYQAYPKAWAQSLLSGPGVANVVDNTLNWTNDQIDNLVSWTNGLNFGQPQINYKSNIPPPPIPNNALKMPFGLQFNNGNQKLVITEIIFKPNESKINLLAQEQFTKSATVYKLGFAGKYLKIHPNSIDFSSGRVELAEDITIPNITSNPKMKFTFKKGTANVGCYVQWADTGITDISLGLVIKFSRDWLLPVPTSSDTVIATISGNGTSMHDILLTGNLPSCEIVGTNGLKILADSISLDLSDTRNPAGMYFPKNYTDDTTATAKLLWQGLYVKSFALTLPETWKTGANPTHITASDLIIDDFGITMKMAATNVITFQSCKVANLSASLDTLDVSILKGSVTSASAKGLLVLPISKDTVTNTLKYTATFSQASGANNFQIVITPIGPIDADILKGKMTLDPTSNITATISPNSKILNVALNGKFNWDNPDFTPPVASSAFQSLGIKGVKMELGFENVGLTYKNTPTADSLTFSLGSWSFASPQKFLANFPVSIKKIYYKSLSTVATGNANIKELLRGAVMIDIVADLTEDIGGSTTLGAAFAVELNTSTIEFTPKFKGVFIDSIAVHADQPAVKIDGYLKMYEHDNVFGDGFKAALGVTFTAVTLQINALVQFGNTTYLNNNQYYRYWRVEADAKFSPGIPFLTGVGFYGFGGGAYFNMKVDSLVSAANPGTYAYTFIPKKSTFGFMVKTTIGTMPKVETFNADVSLMAQFNQNTHGIELIDFTGNFWIATKLTDRPNAKIYGGVDVSYNFPDKIFNMGANLTINVPNVITTPSPVGFVLNIDGRNNLWYFEFGTPSATKTVDVFGLNLYSYLMFGNDIPMPNGFTQNFINGYSTAIGSPPTIGGNVGSGGVGDKTKTGKGIATGVGIQFDKTYNENIHRGLCRQWSIAADLNVGAELNLAFMDQVGCTGINGYRASGNVGLYFNLTTTINGTSFHPKLCSSVSSNLFTVKLGAWLGGEFPNPVYLYGSVSGTIGVFDDLLHIQFNKSFTYGSSCTGSAVATVNAAQEDKAADLKNKLIQYVTPITHYNFPVTSTINAKYNLTPEQVFDVAENEGDGTIKNRTFKLVITKSLEVQNTNDTWSLKSLQSKLNNVGEYQYYLTIPISVSGTVIQASNQLSTTVTSSLNTNNGNTQIARNGAIRLTSIPSSVPPPPMPNFPNPIPNPINSLVADMEYRFIVTATLMESSPQQVQNTGTMAGRGTGYHTEQLWSPAKTRTGVSVTETKTVLFRTGGMPLVHLNSNTGNLTR